MVTNRFLRFYIRVLATGIVFLSLSLHGQVASDSSTDSPAPSDPIASNLVSEVAATSSDLLASQTAAPVQDGNAAQSQQTPTAPTPQSLHDQAEQQLKVQEHQRIMGVIPNFNTVNIQNAVPLSPKQKFSLALRSAVDPFEFVAAGVLAGWGQLENDNAGYGQGAEGYAKRYGASYTDSADGVLWGNAIFPVLLHEDPRYFRRGTGSFRSRFLYAISTTVWTRNDNGTWGPNYANVLGNITAGGISNFYYPSDNRGVGLTFEGAATVTAEGALGALGVEFWPDISRKLFHTRDRAPVAPAPK